MNRSDFTLKILGRTRAYKRIFLGDDGQPHKDGRAVIADLKRFCRADTPCIQHDVTGRIDPLATAYLEGRREVFLRLMKHLHIDERTIMEIKEDDL